MMLSLQPAREIFLTSFFFHIYFESETAQNESEWEAKADGGSGDVIQLSMDFCERFVIGLACGKAQVYG